MTVAVTIFTAVCIAAALVAGFCALVLREWARSLRAWHDRLTRKQDALVAWHEEMKAESWEIQRTLDRWAESRDPKDALAVQSRVQWVINNPAPLSRMN